MAYSTNDIQEAFKAAGLRMDEHDFTIEEVKAALERMQRTLRSYAGALVFGVDERGKDYPGFWPGDAQAEQFGLLVAKAIGRRWLHKDMQTTTGPEGGFWCRRR